MQHYTVLCCAWINHGKNTHKLGEALNAALYCTVLCMDNRGGSKFRIILYCTQAYSLPSKDSYLFVQCLYKSSLHIYLTLIYLTLIYLSYLNYYQVRLLQVRLGGISEVWLHLHILS